MPRLLRGRARVRVRVTVRVKVRVRVGVRVRVRVRVGVRVGVRVRVRLGGGGLLALGRPLLAPLALARALGPLRLVAREPLRLGLG